MNHTCRAYALGWVFFWLLSPLFRKCVLVLHPLLLSFWLLSPSLRIIYARVLISFGVLMALSPLFRKRVGPSLLFGCPLSVIPSAQKFSEGYVRVYRFERLIK